MEKGKKRNLIFAIAFVVLLISLTVIILIFCKDHGYILKNNNLKENNLPQEIPKEENKEVNADTEEPLQQPNNENSENEEEKETEPDTNNESLTEDKENKNNNESSKTNSSASKKENNSSSTTKKETTTNKETTEKKETEKVEESKSNDAKETCEERMASGWEPYFLPNFDHYDIGHQEVIKTSYKYGTKIERVKTTDYAIFKDIGQCVYHQSEADVLDYATFKATTNDFKKEASQLVKDNAKEYNDVLTIVNGYRAEKNVAALTLDSNLSLAATIRALEMGWSGKFSHTRPDGRSDFTILKELNLEAGVEAINIAMGDTTAKGVCSSWKNSPMHYSNMVHSSVKKIGVGHAVVNNRNYWVQIFTS